jgi:FAD/FMN-containing dehydrogenase
MRRYLRKYCESSRFARLRRSKSSLDLHIDHIRRIIGHDCVVTEEMDAFDKYTVDWTGSYQGGGLVCLPRNTNQLADLMKYCYQHALPVVPQGGNTSLCGGSVGKTNTEIILSLAKMKQVLEISDDSVICEAGVTLQELDDAVKQRGCMVPLDLAAKGSCMIGGNISTNAGGLRVLRYGSISKNVLGLEVVLADGTVLNMLTTLLKDNNGYNLSNIFIGSEGTLGIITKAAIRTVPRPSTVNVMLMKV